MHITRETDYAIRAMLYLRNSAGKVSSLKEISAGVHTPAAFMSKVLQQLVRKGLVISKKGKAGGFTLGAAPEKISLGDIVHAACGDGPLIRTTCRRGNKVCPLNPGCGVHGIWEDLSRIMDITLGSRKLSGL